MGDYDIREDSQNNGYSGYKENENTNDHEEIGNHNAEKILARLLVNEVENILNNLADLPPSGYSRLDEISVYIVNRRTLVWKPIGSSFYFLR